MKRSVLMVILVVLVLSLVACAPKAEAVSDLAPICDNFRDLDSWKLNSFRAVESFEDKTLKADINGEVRELTADPKEKVFVVIGREFNGEPSVVAGKIGEVFADVTPNDGKSLDMGEQGFYLFCNAGLWLVPSDMLDWVDINTWNGMNTELIVWPVLNGPYLVENTTTGQVVFAQDVWGKGDNSSKWGYLDPGDGRWGYVYIEGNNLYVTQSKPDLAKMASAVEDINKVLPYDYAGPAEACATVEYFGTVEESRGIEPGLKEKIVEECGGFGLGYQR